ncbi:nucleotidyltransferase [Actinocrispum sp. NPDC049592]|uniref:nucleotidyltransferase n=1 Tax=Actinocrispum sp. NPDC049592 TaxID=3154835 RepID=UPI00341209C9
MTTTAQAFDLLLEEITPTDYQKNTMVPARKESVRAKLSESFPASCDMPFWKIELIGSAAKSTAIRPIDDIDVLAVFSDEKNAYSKYQFDSQKFLYRIREAYAGVETKQVGSRGQAVRVFYQSGGHVDIAPVFFKGGDDYYLPAGDGSWITTSPLKANEWFNRKNSELSYHLRPVVRFAKKWNKEHSKRFRSFHLETMAASCFSSLGSNYRSAMARFFEWAPSYLDVYDPGGHSGNLSSYMTWQQRQDAIASLQTAHSRADKALTAEAQGDHDEARRQWSIVFDETM